MNTKAYVILFSLFLAACGGGNTESEVEKVDTTPVDVNVTVVDPGTDEPEAPEVPSYETHSTNVSGVWSGIVDGAPVIVTIFQATPDSAESPVQALTGSVALIGVLFDVTGTKEGDAWSVSGASAAAILSTDQTLSSAGGSTGIIKISAGGDIGKFVNVSLTKA
ncbi:MAG: hypothetical protein QGI17_15050 [Arenicellales bacterium]|nr:hypothetical protein [Arenicellales bacterium]